MPISSSFPLVLFRNENGTVTVYVAHFMQQALVPFYINRNMALPKVYAYTKHKDYIGTISPSFILVPDNLWLGRKSMYIWVIAGYRLLCEAEIYDICRLFCADIFTYSVSYKVLESGIIDISQHSSKGAFSFYFYFISLGAKLFDYFGDMSRTVSWFPFISQLNMIDEVELHQRMYNLEE